MAQSYDPSTHRVVTIQGVGHTAIPKDVDYSDLHAAINRHIGKTPDAPQIQGDNKGPNISNDVSPADITAEGAVENNPEFISTANDAWRQTGDGTNRGEEGSFTVMKNGDYTPTTFHTASSEEPFDSVSQQVYPQTALTFHTHPNDAEAEPSKADIEVAKRIKRPVLVASRSGLYEISPDGSILQVYKDASWMDKK